jgi:hypothetical protein
VQVINRPHDCPRQIAPRPFPSREHVDEVGELAGNARDRLGGYGRLALRPDKAPRRQPMTPPPWLRVPAGTCNDRSRCAGYRRLPSSDLRAGQVATSLIDHPQDAAGELSLQQLPTSSSKSASPGIGASCAPSPSSSFKSPGITRSSPGAVRPRPLITRDLGHLLRMPGHNGASTPALTVMTARLWATNDARVGRSVGFLDRRIWNVLPGQSPAPPASGRLSEPVTGGDRRNRTLQSPGYSAPGDDGVFGWGRVGAVLLPSAIWSPRRTASFSVSVRRSGGHTLVSSNAI